MKKIIVSGSSGFLGRILVKKIKSLNYDVVSLTSKNDLTEKKSLDQFNSIKFDYFFHLATFSQAGDFGFYNSGDLWIINQQINSNVLNWCAKHQRNIKIISIGSSCAYEASSYAHKEINYLKGIPEKEVFYYGMTKRMLHIGEKSIYDQYGIPYLTLIPATLYGPGYINYRSNKTHFIFDIIKKIIDYKIYKNEIVLWGNGFQKREVIYNEDFANAIILLFENINNEIINISTGKDYSMSEFSELICNIININKKIIRYDESKYVGVKRKILDNRKMLNILPKFKLTPIREGLEKTIKWLESELKKNN